MSRESRRKKKEEQSQKEHDIIKEIPTRDVKEELDSMFNQVPFWDRVKLQMTTFQYNKESPMYKMLFDHKFRYERYIAITKERNSFKNRSQFRSYIYSNYNVFPAECIEYMNFNTSLLDNNYDLKNDLPNEIEENNEPNILIRNRILRYYTRTYKMECLSKVFGGVWIAYLFC
mmetsp:Transcript_16566/g.14464  ORF Transcript_16566/g.14464 Transcript_16566/m.14464 type:complete len:173 (+) Transcript_16566:20-538(+)